MDSAGCFAHGDDVLRNQVRRVKLHFCLTLISLVAFTRALAEQLLSEYILPLPAASSSSGKTSDVDEAAWTDRLLTTMKHLDSIAINTLLGLSGIKLP